MALGPLMLDLDGSQLTLQEKELIAEEEVGGVILFARNYENKAQLTDLVSAIREIKPDILIAVDHEGGRVQRFRDGFTAIPPMAKIGALYDEGNAGSERNANELAYCCGWVIGTELLSLGIDLCFAPVLDVNFGLSEVIGDRAFHRDPAVITVLAGSFVKGLNDAGMAATGKHFPGHGGVAADSHLEIPVDSRDEEQIKRQDLLPFKALAGQLAGVMPAHVIYEQVDPKPAGFSRYWLEEVLRKELGFGGAIFSDDLTMQGASVVGGFEDRAQQALDAGCNMVLVCNDRTGALLVLEYLKQNPHCGDQACLKSLQGSAHLEADQLENSPVWQTRIKQINKLIFE